MINYPLNHNLVGKTALVVGGGNVATRKIQSLIRCDAVITVICEKASIQIQEWAEQGVILWKKRKWRRTDSEDVFLMIAATDSETVNAEIAESVHPNQLICVAGDRSLGNFSVPAVIRRGRLTITVATGGASPFYAKKLRGELDHGLNGNAEEYLDFLFLLRQQILKKNLSISLRKKCLKNVLQPKYLNRNEQIELLKNLDEWIKNQ
jgi:precorrin-2 dehydrogenase/sirohydrochlorin ferrochelatase